MILESVATNSMGAVMPIPVGKKAGPDPRTPGLAPHLDRALGLALDLILGLGLAIGAMLLLSIALIKPANAAESATQRHLHARQCGSSVSLSLHDDA